jgi:hypothetical protein
MLGRLAWNARGHIINKSVHHKHHSISKVRLHTWLLSHPTSLRARAGTGGAQEERNRKSILKNIFIVQNGCTMKKQRYRLVRLGNRNDGFYCWDNVAKSRTSLETNDREEAELLVQHKNEALKTPHINRKIGMAYLSGSDPKLVERIWQDVMDDILKDKHGPTLRRWKTAVKDEAFDLIRKQVVVTTWPTILTMCCALGPSARTSTFADCRITVSIWAGCRW